MTLVRLGALADMDPARNGDPRRQEIRVSEFIDLQDGRRLILHAERGYVFEIRPDGDIWEHATVESVTRDVLNVVLPDEPATEEHPYEWLAERARARGVPVTPDDLRRLPYVVELTDRLRARLAGTVA
jgi:hypothetical protein